VPSSRCNCGSQEPTGSRWDGDDEQEDDEDDQDDDVDDADPDLWLHRERRVGVVRHFPEDVTPVE
jgi:hypothetical protein